MATTAGLWQPQDRDGIVALLEDPARAAVAEAASVAVHAADTAVLGLGSGRAVWATMELLGRRGGLRGQRVVTASSTTERIAGWYGAVVVELDGDMRPDRYIDGADEIAGDLGLIKGHGNALLREKLIAVAARWFVVVAEASKRVGRLGERCTLPVEVVRFGWGDTRRRLRQRFGEVTVRTTGQGQPLVTDEGNLVLEFALPGDLSAVTVARELETTVGVVDHGLFLDLADEVLLGDTDGTVEVLTRADAPAVGERSTR
jgi:ribose 5-phosphate isomerase A